MDDKNIPEDIPEVFSEDIGCAGQGHSGGHRKCVVIIIKKELDIDPFMCYITYVESFR